MGRFVAIAVVVVAVAVAAPWIAPPLLASFIGLATSDDGVSQTAVSAAVGDEPLTEPLEEPVQRKPKPPATDHRATIPADGDGHFVVDARINGREVTAMIDTGATSVALTEATARGLGIIPGRDQYTQPVSTANGIVKAAGVILREIRIGPVLVRNVPAIVVPGNDLTINLVGMSYLRRLARFESAGSSMVLVE